MERHANHQSGFVSKTYSVSIHAGKDFDRVLQVLTQELRRHGFGVVADVDMQTLFKDKLAVDEHRYRIMSVCNPMVSHQALRIDADAGLLILCNIVVRENHDREVTVSFALPETVLGLVYESDIVKLARELSGLLEKVREGLAAQIRQASP